MSSLTPEVKVNHGDQQNSVDFNKSKVLVNTHEDSDSDCQSTVTAKLRKLRPKRPRPSPMNKLKQKENKKELSEEELNQRKEEDEKMAKYINFKCIICPLDSITNLREWSAHQRKVHNEKTPIIHCCDRRLRDRKRILDHISFHHELLPQFECPTCKRRFKRKVYLDSHMRSHGFNQTQKIICDKCPETFIYKSQLIKHQIIHMTPEEQKTVQLFQCKDCPSSFALNHQLLTHIRRVHQRRYSFICHICAKKFNKKERLEAHMLYKHTDNPPTHKCELCGVESVTREAYRRHLKWYHAGDGEFTCDVCGVVRKNELSLKQHKRFTHETERKHACKYCPKAFKRPTELTEHLTTHLGGKLYSCAYCGRGFNSKSNMQSHAKRKCSKNPQLNSLGGVVDQNSICGATNQQETLRQIMMLNDRSVEVVVQSF